MLSTWALWVLIAASLRVWPMARCVWQSEQRSFSPRRCIEVFSLQCSCSWRLTEPSKCALVPGPPSYCCPLCNPSLFLRMNTRPPGSELLTSVILGVLASHTNLPQPKHRGHSGAPGPSRGCPESLSRPPRPQLSSSLLWALC